MRAPVRQLSTSNWAEVWSMEVLRMVGSDVRRMLNAGGAPAWGQIVPDGADDRAAAMLLCACMRLALCANSSLRWMASSTASG